MFDSSIVLGLNGLDLIILGSALALGFWGFRLGLVRASVALLAVVVGVLLAGAYHERVFVDLALSDEPSGAMLIASFTVILSLVIVGGYVVGGLLRGIAALLLLGWADRAAGGLFGLLFALLLAQALIAIVVLAGVEDPDGVIGSSVIGREMMQNTPVVRALLPSEFDLAIQQFVAEVDALRSAVDDAASLGGS